jgi:hypothetical protein
MSASEISTMGSGNETAAAGGPRAKGPGRVPALVTYAGLAVIVGAAAVAIVGGLGLLSAGAALALLKAAAATTLAFLGGIRWGMAMRVETTPRGAVTIAASVLPALAAVVALLLPDAAGLGLLATGLAGVGAWDVWSAEAGGAPSWYGRLRLRATLAAAAALVAVLLSLGI